MAEYFDRGTVLVGGAPIGDLESGRVEFSNGRQNIITLGKGYAGVAKGPVTGRISAKRFVPRAGFSSSQDLHDAVLKQKFVQGMCITGGKKYTVTCVVDGLSRDFGVQAAASEDFVMDGKLEVDDL